MESDDWARESEDASIGIDRVGKTRMAVKRVSRVPVKDGKQRQEANVLFELAILVQATAAMACAGYLSTLFAFFPAYIEVYLALNFW